MGIYFKKIKDFGTQRSLKMDNSSYFEELTGLLAAVSSRIDNGSYYFFDENSCIDFSKNGDNKGLSMYYYFDEQSYLDNISEEPNCNYNKFILQFKNTFNYCSSEKIHIIRGVAGIGKSLFFKKGLQMLLSNSSDVKDKYIPLCVDFKNIDQCETINFYEEIIYRKLRNNAIDAIRMLDPEYYKVFKKSYDDFGSDFDTPFSKLFPLKFFL